MIKMLKPFACRPVASALTLAVLAAMSWFTTEAAIAQSRVAAGHPGEALYKQKCASCHDNAEAFRAPTKSNLAAMSFETIDFSLTGGKMKNQGEGMTAAQRVDLISFLTGKSQATLETWTKDMMCAANRRPVDLASPTIVGFGYDHDNTRSLTAKQAGLTKAQLSNMELAWSIAIPGATEMRSQPAVVGKTLFLPVAQASAVYAIDVSDTAKPCLKWVYKTPTGAPLRTSAAYGVIADGRGVLVISGLDTTVYALDAKTGRTLWEPRKVGTYSWSMNTGTATVLKDRLIIPVSQNEISNAANNAVKCCDNHGYIVSLDPRTGVQQWRYDTMEDAKPIRDRGDGKMLYGPAGAPIWNSPSVDQKRGLIFFGTGEANSINAHHNTDAQIAIRLSDGKEVWSMQATANDVYNIGCGPRPRPDQLNCTGNTVFRDVDFGASTIIGRKKRGVDILYAGQKSGTVWAMLPETGKVLWRTDLGTGGALGGIHWGIAYDNETVYAPITSPGRTISGELPVDPNMKHGLFALDANTGAIKWSAPAAADCTGDRQQRMPNCARQFGYSTAPTVIDGAVVVAGLDGYIQIYDGKDGKNLWKYDTARTYQGINGVAGKGGAIDAASITAANGLLIVNSGYGLFGQAPGNMILAFRPKK